MIAPRQTHSGDVWSPGQAFTTLDQIDTYVAQLKDERNLMSDRLEGPFVQVKFDGSLTTYTYRDPSGKCQVGDLVEVPVGSGTNLKLARIVRTEVSSNAEGSGRA